MAADCARLVCEQLYSHGTTEDLRALALTSRFWNDAATPWLYRNITLEFKPTKVIRTALLLQSLVVTNPANCRHLHSLILNMWPYTVHHPKPELGRWILVQKESLRLVRILMGLVPNLESFVWHAPTLIPDDLVATLNAHPRAHDWRLLFSAILPAEDDCHRGEVGFLGQMHKVWNNPKTSRLLAACQFRGKLDNDCHSQLVFKDLDVSLEEPISLALSDVANDSISTLASLTPLKNIFARPLAVMNYVWYDFRPDNIRTINTMYTKNLCVLKLKLCIDPDLMFTILEKSNSQPLTLKVSQIQYGPFHDLRDRNRGFHYFLLRLNCLQKLQLVLVDTSMAIIRECLWSNRSTLRSLKLQEPEIAAYVAIEAHPLVLPLNSIDVYDLEFISHTCTELNRLGINLNWEDASCVSPHITLLRSFKSLEYLKLYMPVEVNVLFDQWSMNDTLAGFVPHLWTPTLKTLKVVFYTYRVLPDVIMVTRKKVCVVTPDPAINGRFIFTDPCEAALKRSLKSLANSLGMPHHYLPRTDANQLKEHVACLQDLQQRYGIHLLKSIDIRPGVFWLANIWRWIPEPFDVLEWIPDPAEHLPIPEESQNLWADDESNGREWTERASRNAFAPIVRFVRCVARPTGSWNHPTSDR